MAFVQPFKTLNIKLQQPGLITLQYLHSPAVQNQNDSWMPTQWMRNKQLFASKFVSVLYSILFLLPPSGKKKKKNAFVNT